MKSADDSYYETHSLFYLLYKEIKILKCFTLLIRVFPPPNLQLTSTINKLC